MVWGHTRLKYFMFPERYSLNSKIKMLLIRHLCLLSHPRVVLMFFVSLSI